MSLANRIIPLLCCVALYAISAASYAERPTYQWIDQQGIDNWSDRNPLTDPARRAPDQQQGTIPDSLSERGKLIMDFLRSTAVRSIPQYCQQHNVDNPAQLKSCEAFQIRVLEAIETTLFSADAGYYQFAYRRCQDHWLRDKPINLARLAQCMGLKV